MSRPTPNQMMHLKDEHGEKSCPEDLKHCILAGGKIIYLFCIPFLFIPSLALAYLLFHIRIRKENKNNYSLHYIIKSKAPCE